jgi:hypothetical protein
MAALEAPCLSPTPNFCSCSTLSSGPLFEFSQMPCLMAARHPNIRDELSSDISALWSKVARTMVDGLVQDATQLKLDGASDSTIQKMGR